MKAQVLLITIFTLTFALFSVFMLLAPIKDKLLRIKDMEDVYYAISNSETGLEASLMDYFVKGNLSLNKEISTVSDTPDCGGLNPNSTPGICKQIIYSPTGTPPWEDAEKFRVFIFTFTPTSTGEIYNIIFSDGFKGKFTRTIAMNP